MKCVFNLLGASKHHRDVLLGWSVDVSNQLGVREILLLAEEVLLFTGQLRTRVIKLAILHNDNLIILLHGLIFWVRLTQKLGHLRGVTIILKVKRLFKTRHTVVKNN